MKNVKWKALYNDTEKISSSSKIYVAPIKTINNIDPNMFNSNKYPSCRPIRHIRIYIINGFNRRYIYF